MGTRGFVGFVAGGQEKIAYNHAGSHPREVGLDVLSWLRNAATDPDGLHNAATALRVVTESDVPDADTLARLQPYTVPHLAALGNSGWYSALRITQGRPELMLEAGYVLDASAFARSPQMRWGYLIDVDTWNFEVYQGGQREPHYLGRFTAGEHGRPDEFGLYPPALVAAWPVFDLPANADFLTKLGDGA